MSSKKVLASAAYVRFVLNHLDLTPSALAKRAGISSTTLTRMLNDNTYQYSLSIATLDKIAKCSSIGYATFLDSSNGSSLLAASVNSMVHGAHLTKIISEGTTTASIVSAGVWYDLSVPQYGSVNTYGLKFFHSSGERLKAYKVKGNSCDQLAQEGELLLCSDFKTGDLYKDGPYFFVVERYEEAGRLVEISARRTIVEEGWTRFECPSSDPTFVGLSASSPNGDYSKIKPIGLVQCIAREPYG